MRIRTVKPEFWQDEDLAEISEPARLVAIGLLNCADDEGFFNANVRLVGAALFPLTEPSLSIHECFNQLIVCGYLKLHKCKSGKKTYGHVVNFSKHQKVNRPSASKIRGLIDFTDNSLNAHGALTVGKEQGTGNREQGTGKVKEQGGSKNKKSLSAKANDSANEIFNHWKVVMQKSDASKLTKERLTKVSQRLKDGYTVDQIKMAIDGCAMTPHNMGQNDNGKRYDDLELICRTGANLERFANNTTQQTQLSKITQKNLQTTIGDF